MGLAGPTSQSVCLSRPGEQEHRAATNNGTLNPEADRWWPAKPIQGGIPHHCSPRTAGQLPNLLGEA